MPFSHSTSIKRATSKYVLVESFIDCLSHHDATIFKLLLMKSNWEERHSLLLPNQTLSQYRADLAAGRCQPQVIWQDLLSKCQNFSSLCSPHWPCYKVGNTKSSHPILGFNQPRELYQTYKGLHALASKVLQILKEPCILQTQPGESVPIFKRYHRWYEACWGMIFPALCHSECGVFSKKHPEYLQQPDWSRMLSHEPHVLMHTWTAHTIQNKARVHLWVSSSHEGEWQCLCLDDGCYLSENPNNFY